MKTKGLNKKVLDGCPPKEALGRSKYGEAFDPHFHELCSDCDANYNLYSQLLLSNPATPYEMFATLPGLGKKLVMALYDAIQNRNGTYFRTLAHHAENFKSPVDPVESWLRGLMLYPDRYTLEYHHAYLKWRGVPIGGNVRELYDCYNTLAKAEGWGTSTIDHFRRLVKKLKIPHKKDVSDFGRSKRKDRLKTT